MRNVEQTATIVLMKVSIAYTQSDQNRFSSWRSSRQEVSDSQVKDLRRTPNFSTEWMRPSLCNNIGVNFTTICAMLFLLLAVFARYSRDWCFL